MNNKIKKERIRIGINGFGRIGKCVFLQLIDNKDFSICCLNTTSLSIDDIETYLKYDSVHHYNKHFIFTKISDNEFIINHHKIRLFSNRDAKKLPWKEYYCEYLLDCTGAYLTKEKCLEHNIEYVIMSAPPKDETPTFVYSVNDDNYNGENIISGSSCTTNSLAPFLKILEDTFGIEDCIFTTIHSATASQNIVDSSNIKTRSKRGFSGNIIPHTTGASSSINNVIPILKGKVSGTCLRVPTNNCSLLDINITLKNKDVVLGNIRQLLSENNLYGIIYDVNDKKLVSCDFTTTTTPTILDYDGSMDLGNGKFKFLVWYDNEWSYSSQLIRLTKSIYDKNMFNRLSSFKNINKMYCIDKIHKSEFTNKRVVLRLDVNVKIKDGEIVDDYRITSAIPTIKYILNKSPKHIILTSHLGRPSTIFNTNSISYTIVDIQNKIIENNINENNKKKINKNESENNKDNIFLDSLGFSLSSLISILSEKLEQQVEFLPYGISLETLTQISCSKSKIFLLENLRYHEEEIKYSEQCDNYATKIYSSLGNIFICDAFGCVHRKHMSICGPKYFEKEIGYGFLIKKELKHLDELICSNKKILCIVGGNKVEDKLPIVELFSNVKNAKIFVAGALASFCKFDKENIYVMNDGWGSSSLEEQPMYIKDIKNTVLNVYDIGCKSKERLINLIKEAEIIFWNGSLGVIEHEHYRKSSLELINYLNSEVIKDTKKVIIGGGETASLIEDKESNSDSNIYVSTGGGAMLDYLQKKLILRENPIGLQIYE